MKDSPVNSEFTTIRSLIVLLFLIGLPVVAIMPEGVQGALKGFLPQEESDPPTASVPPLRGNEPLPNFPVLTSPTPTEDLPPVVRLADFEISQEDNNAVRPISSEVSTDFVSPANGLRPRNGLPRPSEQMSGGEGPAGGMINQNTNTIQAELDRLGATYYRLESWGNAPRVYRFHCTVTIKIGLAEYSRRFEATAESPEGAMQQVQTEVQTWHDRFSSGNQVEMGPVADAQGAASFGP